MTFRVSRQPPAQWNERIARLPGAHALQTTHWAKVKQPNGWAALYVEWPAADSLQAAALILLRILTFGGFSARLKVLYCPRGPLLDWANPVLRKQVLNDLATIARQEGAIFIKIDPDVRVGSGVPGSAEDVADAAGVHTLESLQRLGWRLSEEQIQFRNTAVIDLSDDENTLLAKMKQKTRYNIRLAERKGVKIRPGGLADLGLLYQMYAETSVRDGFVIREEAYYRLAWGEFIQAGLGEALLAEVEGDPVAGMVLYRFGGTAWYMFGMSREQHREKMPSYLLQWIAMQRSRAAGCHSYDLWGAPDVFDESDRMWGVYRFKEGLGAQVRRTLGAWDLPIQPVMYSLYAHILPRFLEVLRRRGKARTRNRIAQIGVQ
jgi:lipid II:glycine glycyltransferase (peptidoglycan interpeptide bridge formation enzyme)